MNQYMDTLRRLCESRPPKWWEGYYIASVSWGKDSLAMLLHLLFIGAPLDEVLFYNTGMEFQAIYAVRDAILPILRAAGIKYTELQPPEPFLWSMLERPVESKQKGKHLGYGWCGGVCRWGTTEKNKAMDAYAEKLGATVYVGIAADELPRLLKKKKQYKIHPLADWGMTERDCKRYCYAMGFRWEECGMELYRVLQRVSCWCCCNKNLRELKNIYKYLPEYWEKLKYLQARMERPMKGFYTDGQPKGIFELEKRFEQEIAAERRRSHVCGNRLKCRKCGEPLFVKLAAEKGKTARRKCECGEVAVIRSTERDKAEIVSGDMEPG